MKGKAFHNESVEQALIRFQSEGWRVIRHNERLPAILAIKDSQIFAVVVLSQRRSKKTREWKYRKTRNATARKWPYLDGLHSIRRRIPKDNLAIVKKAGIANLKQQGWRIIHKGKKSPDALLFKDGKLVAYECLAAPKANPNMRYTVAAKKANYAMFDSVIVEVVRQNL